MFKGLLKRYAYAEDGNFAMIFALGMTVVVGIIGTSMDFTIASSADKKSQQISDAVALNGAIYVKNNGFIPKQQGEGGLPPGNYTAAELGFDFKNWVIGGSAGVNVNVAYDDSAKEVTVTVSGETETTFTRVLGKEKLNFESESVVSYLLVEDTHPASIALVLDNSGSMAWDDRLANSDGSSPSGAIQRLAGLKASVKGFRTDLHDRVGAQTTSDYRVVRMGMLPYSSDTIDDAVVDMKWGYINTSDVDNLTASGTTNSSPPMATAKDWMENEDSFHDAEAAAYNKSDYDKPLKFAVLMSDGENTVGNWEFYPNDEAPVYWKQKENGYWTGVWAWGYDPTQHHGYTRGDLRRHTDRLTIDSCDDMKDDGVDIFTIGYALEEGHYNRRSSYNSKSTYYVNAWTKANAWNLLQSCASSDENFIWAENAERLEAAFDRIQNEIVEEMIRLKS